MQNKGQITLTVFFTMFMAVFVGLVLFLAVAQQVGSTLATGEQNDSLSGSTTVGANGVTVDLEGQELLGTPIVINSSSGLVVAAANYTIDEGVSATTGVKTVQYTTDTTDYQSQAVNISYTYGPDGYMDNAGARSIVPLITIFFALAILVIAMEPVMRSKVLEMVGK